MKEDTSKNHELANSLQEELERVQEENARILKENVRLRQMLGLSLVVDEQAESNDLFVRPEPLPRIDSKSSVEEKIHLFRSLFRGRDDVFALHWINERTGKKGYSPARADAYGKAAKRKKKYLPLTDEVLHDHLSGEKVVGVYSLLKDDTCWFLACDFDGTGWELDAHEYLATCSRWKIPAYLERSRSGNGSHVWIFFSAPVPAVLARRLGISLLRETMLTRAEMDLASYDRFFPNQDFMPKGGFGNLIALPLQKKARALGNTEFLDTSLNPWPDQWAFLSQVRRLPPQQVEGIVDILPPVGVGPGHAGIVLDSSKDEPAAPPKIQCGLWTQVSIEKSGLPPSLFSRIKHLASLHNPEFYQKQKLRLSTYQTPRFIKCYGEDLTHLHLPRGLFSELEEIVKEADSRLQVKDLRRDPERLSLAFNGCLTPRQEEAVKVLLSHEQGVLVAPPGIGKTIIACAVAASRNVPTLILVHRKPLLDQWRVQIMNTLGLLNKDIGQIGGGRCRQSGLVDLGMIQSLSNRTDVEQIFDKYGLIVVDECHHIPAVSFEKVINRAPIRYILGLTATPYRRDGLQDIITMQCGPIRHKISSQQASKDYDLDLRLTVRETSFEYSNDEEVQIQEVFRELIRDAERTSNICIDVLEALGEGRRILILSEWREHCRMLADKLAHMGKTAFVLDGTLKKKARDEMFASMRQMTPEKDLLVIATGNYIGEGFDCPQIDTLFLAFPISFRGRIVQYVGRLMRQWEGKTEVRVYDYADTKVSVLKRMHNRRLKAYCDIGFATNAAESNIFLE